MSFLSIIHAHEFYEKSCESFFESFVIILTTIADVRGIVLIIVIVRSAQKPRIFPWFKAINDKPDRCARNHTHTFICTGIEYIVFEYDENRHK